MIKSIWNSLFGGKEESAKYWKTKFEMVNTECIAAHQEIERLSRELGDLIDANQNFALYPARTRQIQRFIANRPFVTISEILEYFGETRTKAKADEIGFILRRQLGMLATTTRVNKKVVYGFRRPR